MKITINENDTKEPKRKTLPKGKYIFRITEAEERQSHSGNDMLCLTLEHESGIKVFDYIVPSKAKWKLATLLKACQLPHSGDVEFSCDDIIGCYVEAEITLQDDPNWGLQNKVKKYNEAPILMTKDKLKLISRLCGDEKNFNLLPELFFCVPASSRHHSNGWGGLARHSYNVYSGLLMFGVEKKIAFQIGMYHDLCKLYFYERDFTETGEAFYKTKKDTKYDNNITHGLNSVRKIKELGIELEKPVLQAIQYHMGLWEQLADESYKLELSNAMNKNVFIALTQCADLFASHCIENAETC